MSATTTASAEAGAELEWTTAWTPTASPAGSPAARRSSGKGQASPRSKFYKERAKSVQDIHRRKLNKRTSSSDVSVIEQQELAQLQRVAAEQTSAVGKSSSLKEHAVDFGNENESNSEPNVTHISISKSEGRKTKQLFIWKPGEYSLQISLPPEANAKVFGSRYLKVRNMLSLRKTSKVRVHLEALVRSSDNKYLDIRRESSVVTQGTTQHAALSADTRADTLKPHMLRCWINPTSMHNTATLNFSVKHSDLPAIVEFTMECHSFRFVLNIDANLMYRPFPQASVENVNDKTPPEALSFTVVDSTVNASQDRHDDAFTDDEADTITETDGGYSSDTEDEDGFSSEGEDLDRVDEEINRMQVDMGNSQTMRRVSIAFEVDSAHRKKGVRQAIQHTGKLLPLKTGGRWFCEEDIEPHLSHGFDTLHLSENEKIYTTGRRVLLRGVNLSGSVKQPTRPVGHSHLPYDWAQLKDAECCKSVSFVGRPFPLDEADEHLSRLQSWGFNCLRFLVTWEAVEHAGPGVYDEEYLDYIQQVVRLAGEYRFYCFIDPHQDVWSRMTGGSGAPAWTFEVCGLDLAKLEASESCFTHTSHEQPQNFTAMTWPQNYQRFACLHMFTLFWGGNYFAPEFSTADGVPVQEYLQSHFINAMLEVAKRLVGMSHVIGFDSFNEPSPGFIGNNLAENPEPVIPPGAVFKPFEAMTAGAGFPTTVRVANAIALLLTTRVANPDGVSAYLDGHVDVWQHHGVWRAAPQPELLNPSYFQYYPSGQKIEFFRDFLRPFMVRYIGSLREVLPRSILFAEGDGFGSKEFTWDTTDPSQIVNTSHWYDGFTLFSRSYNPRFSIDVVYKRPVLGASNIYKMHLRDLKQLIRLPRTLDGGHSVMPTLIGEFGIPYNMNSKVGYRKGDFSNHINALSVYYDLFDELQLHSTQWNYCPDNCNEWGDNWNLEDLSIFSRDQQQHSHHVDLDSGGRAVLGFCRPFAPFVCGIPESTYFNSKTCYFNHSYFPDRNNFNFGDFRYSTEIYVPNIQYTYSSGSGVEAIGAFVSFDVIILNGYYKRRRYNKYHIIHVWADSAKHASGAFNMVEVSIVKTHTSETRPKMNRRPSRKFQPYHQNQKANKLLNFY